MRAVQITCPYTYICSSTSTPFIHTASQHHGGGGGGTLAFCVSTLSQKSSRRTRHQEYASARTSLGLAARTWAALPDSEPSHTGPSSSPQSRPGTVQAVSAQSCAYFRTICSKYPIGNAPLSVEYARLVPETNDWWESRSTERPRTIRSM